MALQEHFRKMKEGDAEQDEKMRDLLNYGKNYVVRLQTFEGPSTDGTEAQPPKAR